MSAVNRNQIPRVRDNFTKQTIRVLAGRVGWRCSNPACRKPTAGPHSDVSRAVTVGVGAHIAAAAARGPRFDPGMTAQQRRSSENGIWLCQSCARLIDVDEKRFGIDVLRGWRREAERAAEREVGLVQALNSGMGWVWNRETHTYRDRETGDLVGPREILAIRDDYLAVVAKRARYLSTRALNGTMWLDKWQMRMLRELKNVYIAGYALGHGGWWCLNEEACCEIGVKLATQLKLLQDVAWDLARGEYSVGKSSVRRGDLHRRVSELIFSVREALEWP